MIETPGQLFRTVLANLVNQRVMDVSCAEDNRIVILFENGESLTFDRFSYELATQEGANKLKQSIGATLENPNDVDAFVEGKEFHFELEEDGSDEDDDEDDN